MGKKKLSKNQIYWLLQVMGWSGMATFAILNNVIMRGLPFVEQLGRQFTGACLGLIISHAYKIFVLRRYGFHQSNYKIISHAILAILVISASMTFFAQFVISDETSEYPTFLIFIIRILNLGTFVAPWVISYFIFKIFEKNKTISEQKIQLEILTQVTEFELLKKQLNPHFLFNALNSIKALIQLDNKLAADALSKLSELLHFSLNYQKQNTISIEEEMAEVDKYLALEKIRFGDRLQYTSEIFKGSSEAQIPPAIILTLAENAIKHGIAQLENGGLIRIESTCQGNWINVKVCNSGQLKMKKTNGIGLINIQKRLENLTGLDASLKILQKQDNMVETIIQYPLNFKNAINFDSSKWGKSETLIKTT